MNGQATALQKLANVLDPAAQRSIPRWLLHSVSTQVRLSSIQTNMEVVLNQMGWQCRNELNRIAGIQICETGEPAINLGRLTDGVLIIFVLDAEPVTLVNTYSQIKQLVGQRPELRSWIAVASICLQINSNSPAEEDSRMGDELEEIWGQEQPHRYCQARKLLTNCQRFLGFCPGYLGVLPADPPIGVAASEGKTVADRCSHSPWSQGLNRVVRRALELSQKPLQATQEPDELSSCFSLES